MDEYLKEQTNNRPWLYKKGQSGNPKGRPKGSFSMKEYIKKKLYAMSDEEREEFLEGIDKKVIWEMAEGKPEAKTEVKATVDINKISELSDDELDNIIATSVSTES